MDRTTTKSSDSATQAGGPASSPSMPSLPPGYASQPAWTFSDGSGEAFYELLHNEALEASPAHQAITAETLDEPENRRTVRRE